MKWTEVRQELDLNFPNGWNLELPESLPPLQEVMTDEVMVTYVFDNRAFYNDSDNANRYSHAVIYNLHTAHTNPVVLYRVKPKKSFSGIRPKPREPICFTNESQEPEITNENIWNVLISIQTDINRKESEIRLDAAKGTLVELKRRIRENYSKVDESEVPGIISTCCLIDSFMAELDEK